MSNTFERLALAAVVAATLPFALGAVHAAEPARAQSEVPAPTLDTDQDGKADAWDRDGDGKADAWDRNGDGVPDAVDDDGDGRPDPAAPAESAAE